MSLFDWWNARLEHKLGQNHFIDLSTPADFKYPPPSAYEVKQITEELKLNSHMVSRPTDKSVCQIKGK